MQNMSVKKNGTAAPREGSASAVREAARSADTEKDLPRASEAQGFHG
jgi:hypothetical protein